MKVVSSDKIIVQTKLDRNRLVMFKCETPGLSLTQMQVRFGLYTSNSMPAILPSVDVFIESLRVTLPKLDFGRPRWWSYGTLLGELSPSLYALLSLGTSMPNLAPLSVFANSP